MGAQHGSSFRAFNAVGTPHRLSNALLWPEPRHDPDVIELLGPLDIDNERRTNLKHRAALASPGRSVCRDEAVGRRPTPRTIAL